MKQHKRPKNASSKKLSHKPPAKTPGKAAIKPARPQQAGRPWGRGEGTIRLPAGEVLYGLHAVRAALQNPEREILALYVTEAVQHELPPLQRGLRATYVTRQQLDHVMQGAVHQGIMAVAAPLPEMDIDDVIRAVQNKERGLVVLLDQVTDPHNVGAILRSAAVFGVTAVITTERNAPHTTGVLAKAASGALERVALVRVVNLARTLDLLGKADFWRVGLAESGQKLGPDALQNIPPFVALVMGAEGDGLRRLTKEHCDALLALPTAAEFSTLNVSNAAAVALYQLFVSHHAK